MKLFAVGLTGIATVKRLVRTVWPVGRNVLVKSVLMAGLLLCPFSLVAHEFWIEPSSFQPEPSKSLTVDLLIGTNFLGSSAIYAPDQIEAFSFLRTVVGKQSELREITGRYGDRPAGTIVAGQKGFHIILHQTAPIRLTYDSAEKFDKFAREKGFNQALAQHQALGLPRNKITEKYQRFAKSLIAVGGSISARMGEDRLLGLAIELVAEANPYQSPSLQNMPVRLFASGKPLANAQITVFTRHNPRHVEKAKYVTNSEGRISFVVLPGRDYLVDSVILQLPDKSDDEASAMWVSNWASLTFQIPN